MSMQDSYQDSTVRSADSKVCGCVIPGFTALTPGFMPASASRTQRSARIQKISTVGLLDHCKVERVTVYR